MYVSTLELAEREGEGEKTRKIVSGEGWLSTHFRSRLEIGIGLFGSNFEIDIRHVCSDLKIDRACGGQSCGEEWKEDFEELHNICLVLRGRMCSFRCCN